MHEFRPFQCGQRQEQVRDATPAEFFGKCMPPSAMPLLRSSQVSPGTAFARYAANWKSIFAPWKP